MHGIERREVPVVHGSREAALTDPARGRQPGCGQAVPLGGRQGGSQALEHVGVHADAVAIRGRGSEQFQLLAGTYYT